MKPLLTTITVYWNRPEMLRRWFRALQGVTLEGRVEHLLFWLDGPGPYPSMPNLRVVRSAERPGHRSIGHFHNIGAELANTEWIMKLDVDTIVNSRYFQELLPLLEKAGAREWFNGGMVYVNSQSSHRLLDEKVLPLSDSTYETVMSNVREHFNGSYLLPQATNWICRKRVYQGLGGCDEQFRGYGWEDYQQVYMLEKCQQGKDPLPGDLTLDNITRRCRDEIARPKAAALYAKSSWLSLLHCWHPMSTQNGYRSFIHQNRQVLLNWIQKARTA